MIQIPEPIGPEQFVLANTPQTLDLKTLNTPTISGAVKFEGTTQNMFVQGAEPASANRTVTIPDPGADADVILSQRAAGQTIANATLDNPDVVNPTNKIIPVWPSAHLPGNLSVAVLAWEWAAPADLTLRSATGRLKTAPTGDAAIIDVRVNGASIFASQAEMIAIADGTQQDTSATKNAAVSAGDIITLECEQIGSSVAGADLTVVLNCLTAMDKV